MSQETEFKKEKPAAGSNGSITSVSALIAGGVAVVGKLVLGVPYTIYSPDDAKTIGIDAAYDTANSVVLFHHIEEFYRGGLAGTKLVLMVVAQSVTPSVMLVDAANLYARKLIAFAQGEVYQLGVAYNGVFTEQVPETITDGISSNIRSAISVAQEFALWCAETDRPCQIVLEGRSYSGNAVGAIDLKDLVTGADIPLEADKVSIVISQDWNYAEGLAFASGKKYADVGLALGVLSGINVNQSIGEVQTLNLTDAIRQKYTVAGLSSHEKVEAVEASLATLDIKGYIFPMKYTGISGYRFNNDHVCAPEIVDADGVMNESTISLGRAMDHSIRLLRAALTPKIKSVQSVDKKTGKLAIGVVKSFDKIGNNIFDDLEAAGLINGGKTYTNADSDLLTGEKALLVDFDLQPTGTINKIKGSIALKKSL